MKTECFRPAVAESAAQNVAGGSENGPDGIFFSKGWCKTAGVIGSASCEMAGSKVACFVFAPRPSAKLSTGFESGSVECEVFFASHVPSKDEDERTATQKRLAQKVVDAVSPAVILDRYPKSAIYISAVVLQSSSFDLTALRNCASLALCDGAVEMKDVLASYCLAATPTSQSVDVACLPTIDEMTALDTEGRFAPLQLMQIVEKLREHCKQVRQLIIDSATSS